jgi:hypothetical protein
MTISNSPVRFTLPTTAQPFKNCFILSVTPVMAQQWLKANNFNRPLKPRLVDKYVSQMCNGNWQRTHQGIAFDFKGTILDGQHRLWAIVQSGCTLPMLIFLNESRRVHESIDGGKPRSLLDVIRLELCDNTIKNHHILVAKSMWAGRDCVNQDHLTAVDVCRLLRTFNEPIRFAVDLLGNSYVKNVVVMGVIARAYQSVDHASLYEFCNILLNGYGVHSGMNYILQFRNWILGLRDRQEATRRDIYKRTETVLKAFLNNQETCDMIADHVEYYPLYGNQTDK